MKLRIGAYIFFIFYSVVWIPPVKHALFIFYAELWVQIFRVQCELNKIWIYAGRLLYWDQQLPANSRKQSEMKQKSVQARLIV